MPARIARLLLASLALSAAAPVAGCAQQPSGARGRARPAPTLVVFFTVDQMRADYFERFAGQLTGGLGRLYRGGAVFTNAFQDHAVTETAPGHASTLSGRFPRSTGIVINAAGVQDPQAPLLAADGPGASPFRFRGTTLTDWMRVKDPRTRALSVSRKDRGAILPLGRAKQEAFWYASNGTFTTSTYYHDTLPGWVARFNSARVPQSYAGKSWTPLLADSAYREPDSVRAESRGQDFVFPHQMAADPAVAAQQLPAFPWMDQLTLDLALAGAREMKLGAGPQTDVLAISLSTTDAVGHRFGPDSKELHDQILRLDRSIGAFLDSLFAMRDSSRVLIALTADHGVAPYPEVHARDPNAGARHVDLSPLLGPVSARLRAGGVDTLAIEFFDGLLFVDDAAVANSRKWADSLVISFAEAARRVPGVLRADFVPELATKGDTATDAVARRWVHTLPPDIPARVAVTLRPYSVWGAPGIAEHGSPHDYDAHVPLIFYGAPFAPGKYDVFARVVDIAPTLAEVLHVRPTERLDGVVLRRALR